VRFRRLEVRAYRAIDQAELEFGPGLNVFYGPNDLGKSTLAAAMRAVLLLPSESTAHQAFVPWHDAGPPRVRLTFERDGALFRVTKVFGSGSLASAQLESSPDGSSYHEEEKGRAVDRRLRELLRWGIEAPGGKGAARGLPESFLSHVLLGEQGDVPQILERSLDADRDGSGKERLYEALSALSQDPIFKRVLEAAQAKVDAAFTPTGRRKTGQSSPLSPIKEQITLLAQEFERLEQQRRESEEVQQRIASADEQRLALEAHIAGLEARVARESEQLERLAARRRALERVALAEQALKGREALRAELAAREAELAELRASGAAQADAIAAAASRRSEAEALALSTERMLAEQMGAAALARQATARAGFDARCQQKRLEHAALARSAELERAAAAAAAALEAERTVLAAAEPAQAESERALAAISVELTDLGQLEGLIEWRAAELAAERARAALADARGLAEQAEAWRVRAAQARAARAPGEVSNATLAELRQLSHQLEVAAARLEVGLDVVLSVPEGRAVRLRVDAAAEQPLVAARDPIRQRAKNRVVAHIDGGIELSATAGDPALRGELEALERRWAVAAVPLLEAWGVTDVAELAERLETERAREREAAECLREAASAEARANEKRDLAADLEQHERRAEQRLRALGGADLAALEARLGALVAPPATSGATSAPGKNPSAKGSRASAPAAASPARARGKPSDKPPAPNGLEAMLAERRSELQGRLARAQAELAERTAARVRSLTRTSSLEETAAAARARLLAAWAAHAGPELPVPPAAELDRQLGAAARASADAASELERWDRQLAAQNAAAQRERERAARALDECRERYDAAQTASLTARERLLTLEAQLAERRQRIDPAAESAAREELERARGALASLGELTELAPERLAESQRELALARAERERVLAELRRAEGALGHIGGDVVAMRERETQEALERARALELDQEREYDAYRLLVEQLREAENEQGAHLGRALEAPVSERFARLTQGRYRQVGLDGGLGLQGVAVAGRQRSYGELSEGTQEQLATILRLCVAEQLETALVLDDHLAQTHRERAEWFRKTLREAASRIQIVVLTARPEDYLAAEELCNGTPCKDIAADRVRVIDLERVIKRAHYGVAH
jgi:energy-coupling factor transporter ATP-binding protein EcfA2